MKKRIISALLLASMVLTVSCGTANTPVTDTETTADTVQEQNENYVDPGLTPANFEKDFNIYTSDFYNCENWIYSAENDGEIMALNLYRGRSHVEETYGVTINIEVQPDPYTMRSIFHNMMMSGDTTYQLLYNHDTCTMTNAMNGDFQNIMNLSPYIDMSKPWWSGTTEMFTIDGKLLFTSTCLDLSSIFLNFLLVYNKTLAANNNLDIPYDDIIAGEWYMDDFIALTQGLNQDLNGDTVINENDQFGLATSKYAMMGLQSALGAGMLINNEGVIELNTDMDRLVGVLEKWEKLMENGTHTFGEVNGGGEELFINNQAVFMLGEARNLYNTVRQSDVVYGILPVPKYDETQTDYASAGCALYWAIPVTVPEEDLECVGTVIQALSAYNYNYTVPAVWETILGGKLSESDEDAAMFEIIRGSQYVDLGFAFSLQSKQLEELVFALENTSSDKISSYFAMRKSAANFAVKEINTFYQDHE